MSAGNPFVVQAGWVRWPRPGGRIRVTGLQGTWVYALAPADPEPPESVDTFVASQVVPVRTDAITDPYTEVPGAASVIALPPPDTVASDNLERVYPHLATYTAQPAPPWGWTYNAGTDVLAAVCLGATNRAYLDDDTGRYWAATPDDLTPAGRTLLALLEQLYRRDLELVTYVDA